MPAASRPFARRAFLTTIVAALSPLLAPSAFSAAEPIKLGFSMALTGAVAPNGKQNLLALEIWRDDVNAKGGILGRPVSSSITTIKAIRTMCLASIPS